MRTFLISLAVTCTFFCASPVWAGSGAYRTEVPDAGPMGMGGSGVGQADRPSAVYYNPAGTTQIKTDSISIGVSSITPMVSYLSETGDKVQMKDDTFFIPNFYYVTRLGMERVALGVGATSSWGLITDWGNAAGIRYDATRTELNNKDFLVTAAYKVTDQLSFSVGADIDDSHVDKQRAINDAALGGSGDGNLKLKGDNTSVGPVLAALYKLNEQHQFGLVYRGAIEHKYKGKIYADNLSGLFAGPGYFNGSSFETNIVSKSTLPQSAALGYTFKPNNKWLINADVEWMDWGAIKEEEFASEDPLPTPGAVGLMQQLGTTNRDYHDAWSFDAGAQYSLTDRFRLRGGYFFHQTPIPEATFDNAVPDNNSNSFTTGFGYDIKKNLTFDFAWAAMFYKTRRISNNVEDITGNGVNGTYHQWVNLVLGTVTYSF